MANLARQVLVAIAPIAFGRLCDALKRRHGHRDAKPENGSKPSPSFAVYVEQQRGR